MKTRVMPSRPVKPVHLLTRFQHLARVVCCWLVGGVLVLGFASPGRANFHLWEVNELYSSADGSVQFIEFTTTLAGQEVLANHVITCSGPLGTRSFTLSSNLAAGTANKTFIIGTSNLASVPGGVKPDYIFTNTTPFLFLNAGATNTVALVGAITTPAAYTNLPTDGSRSLIRTGSGSSFATVVTNSPKNYNNQSNRLVPVQISSADLSGTDFILSFPTASGPNGTTGSNYTIEVKSAIGLPTWTTISNVTGDGTIRTTAIPVVPASNVFFRLRWP